VGLLRAQGKITPTMRFVIGPNPRVGRGELVSAVAWEILFGVALASPGHPVRNLVRGPILSAPDRKVYLDWLRGVAVIAMVMSHVNDAWTREADRQSCEQASASAEQPR